MERILTAAPLGWVVIVIGFVLAIVFFVRLGDIADKVTDNDVKQTIEALRMTLPVLWLGFALWGWQLIDTALERKDVKERLQAHQQTLERIEASLTEQDVRKKVETQKSRSFWDKFRPRLLTRVRRPDFPLGALPSSVVGLSQLSPWRLPSGKSDSALPKRGPAGCESSLQNDDFRSCRMTTSGLAE